MIRKISITLFIITTLSLNSKAQKRDTVIVELAQTSKVIFTIQDRSDLETLKNYDFQKLFKDIISKLEKKDTALIAKMDTTRASIAQDDLNEDDNKYWHRHGGSNNDSDYKWGSYRWGKTWQTFTFDLGTNNFLEKGKFPDQSNANYAVKPWGSWYFAMNSTQRTRLAKKLFLEWGMGLSWYNFKFQNSSTKMNKDDTEVYFDRDLRDYDFIKSKLTASYINASLIPVIDFSGDQKKSRMWDGNGSFRIGLGPYVGYRISSHSKLVYKDNGPRKKEKDHDNFYLNNVRYGARLQIGFRSTDLFLNYDLNQLISNNKGPNLNAFSFGVIF